MVIPTMVPIGIAHSCIPTPGQITSHFGLLFPQNLLSCQTNLTDGFLAPSPFFSTTFFLKIQKKPLTQKIR